MWLVLQRIYLRCTMKKYENNSRHMVVVTIYELFSDVKIIYKIYIVCKRHDDSTVASHDRMVGYRKAKKA